MKSVRIVSLIAILVVACMASASAASVFTSRSVWESQVSGVTTEDFNALAGNFYQTLTSGNVTFDVPGSSGSDSLWVSRSGSYAPIDVALVGNYGMTTVRGMFGSGVTGVGADVANLSVNDSITIAVDINGGWSQYQVAYTYPNAFFWGIIAAPGETIDGITFSPTTSNWVGIDNFSYGAGELSSVPEPAAYLLLGPALCMIGFAARRRKLVGIGR